MRLSWNGDTRRVDPANEVAPIPGPVSLSLVTDSARCFLVQVTDCDKLRRSFSRERGVNASVLATKAADSDNCRA
jgi:hypothetical protein